MSLNADVQHRNLTKDHGKSEEPDGKLSALEISFGAGSPDL